LAITVNKLLANLGKDLKHTKYMEDKMVFDFLPMVLMEITDNFKN